MKSCIGLIGLISFIDSSEFSWEVAEGEFQVSQGGGDGAVVVAHDAVALLERAFVVLGCKAVG